MASDIFICYATHDLDFVRQLQQHLEMRGFSTWLDSDNENTTLEHVTNNKRFIQDSKLLLLITSPASVNSAKVRSEVSAAYESYGKPFISLQWQPVAKPPRTFRSLLLRASEQLDFAGNASIENIDRLAQLLGQYAPPQLAAEPKPAPAPSGSGRKLGGLTKKTGPKRSKSPITLGVQVMTSVIIPLDFTPDDEEFISTEIKWLFSAADHLLKLRDGQIDRDHPIALEIPLEAETLPETNNRLLGQITPDELRELANRLARRTGGGFLGRLDTWLNNNLKGWLDQEIQAGEAGKGDETLQNNLKLARVEIVKLLKDISETVNEAYGVRLTSPDQLLDVLESHTNPIALGASIISTMITPLELTSDEKAWVAGEITWLFSAVNTHQQVYQTVQRELAKKRQALKSSGMSSSQITTELTKALAELRRQAAESSQILAIEIPPEAEVDPEANNRLLNLLDDSSLSAYYRITTNNLIGVAQKEFTVGPILRELQIKYNALTILRQREVKMGEEGKRNVDLQNRIRREQLEIAKSLQEMAQLMQAAYGIFITTPDQLTELLDT